MQALASHSALQALTGHHVGDVSREVEPLAAVAVRVVIRHGISKALENGAKEVERGAEAREEEVAVESRVQLHDDCDQGVEEAQPLRWKRVKNVEGTTTLRHSGLEALRVPGVTMGCGGTAREAGESRQWRVRKK